MLRPCCHRQAGPQGPPPSCMLPEIMQNHNLLLHHAKECSQEPNLGGQVPLHGTQLTQLCSVSVAELGGASKGQCPPNICKMFKYLCCTHCSSKYFQVKERLIVLSPCDALVSPPPLSCRSGSASAQFELSLMLR
jgi:hypothetical protein